MLNVSVTTWAALASASSTSPRFTAEDERTRARYSNGLVDGLENLVLDLDERGGLAGCGTRLSGDGGEHVADVRGRLAGGNELAPVLGEHALRSLARYVDGGGDGDDAGMRQRLRDIYVAHDRARVVAEAQRPVEHPRYDDVVDERLVAERERRAPVAGGARADAPRAFDLGQRLSAPGAGCELDSRRRSSRSPCSGTVLPSSACETSSREGAGLLGGAVPPPS